MNVLFGPLLVRAGSEASAFVSDFYSELEHSLLVYFYSVDPRDDSLVGRRLGGGRVS